MTMQEVLSVASAPSSTQSVQTTRDVSGRRRGRRGRRRGPVDGQTTPTEPAAPAAETAAPWLRSVPALPLTSQPLAPVEARVPLGQEILDFAAFVALTSEERAAREMLRPVLSNGAKQHWPEGTVKVYGSFAYDLSMPSSELDFIVENCARGVYHPDTFPVFVQYMKEIGYEVLVAKAASAESVASGYGQAFVKTRDPLSGVVANITVISGKSPVRKTVDQMKRLLDRFPAAGPVTLVLRTVLSQCGLTNASEGGISSFALLLMIFHLMLYREAKAREDGCGEVLLGPTPWGHKMHTRADPGDVLRDFLRYYGNEFNFARYAITLTPTPMDRTDVVESNASEKTTKSVPQVFVCDPLNPESNVTQVCMKIRQIKAMFKCCYLNLQQWEAGKDADTAEFRGKTALSTIISTKKLWERRARLERKASEEQPWSGGGKSVAAAASAPLTSSAQEQDEPPDLGDDHPPPMDQERFLGPLLRSMDAGIPSTIPIVSGETHHDPYASHASSYTSAGTPPTGSYTSASLPFADSPPSPSVNRA